MFEPLSKLLGLSRLRGASRDSLQARLPWLEIKGDIVHNKDGTFEFGLMFELPCTTLYEDYLGILTGLRSVLVNDIDEGGRVRFMLDSHPTSDAIIKEMQGLISADEPGIRHLVNERVRQFDGDRRAGDLKAWRLYCCVLSSARGKKEFTLSEAQFERRCHRVSEARKQILDDLSALGYHGQVMRDNDLFNVMFRYMNPNLWDMADGEYQPTWQRYHQKTVERVDGVNPSTLCAQLGETTIDNGRSEVLRIGDTWIRMLALNKLPDKETFVNMLEPSLLGGERFFVVVDFYHQPMLAAMEQLRGRTRRYEAAHGDGTISVDVEVTEGLRESRGLLERLRETQDHLFSTSVGFILYDSDEANLRDRSKALYQELQYVPGRPFRHLSQGLFEPYLQFAPFSGQRYSERIMLTGRNAVHFLPLNGPYRGAEKPIAYYNNRYNSVTGISAFEGPNHNGLVIGSGGSGKTFFMNHLLSWFLADKTTQVIIIDRGGGYLPLCHLTNGVHIPLSVGGGVRVNPFHLDDGLAGPSDARKQQVQRLIRAMVPASTREKQQLENSILGSAISQVYSTGRRYDVVNRDSSVIMPTLSDLVMRLMQLDKVNNAPAAQSDKDIAMDLVKRLQPWTAETPLGRFVDGQMKLPLSDARVVYYDTEGIDVSEDFKAVGTMLIADLVWQRITKQQGRRTLLILDEGWSMMQGSEEARRFVEEMFRRVRHYGAGIIAVSQTYSDFVALNEITNNASMFFGLRSSAAERKLWLEHMQLPERLGKLLREMRTSHKSWREVMAIFQQQTGWEGGILGVHPTLADFYAFSSDATLKARRDKLLADHGGNISTVLRILCDEHEEQRRAA